MTRCVGTLSEQLTEIRSRLQEAADPKRAAVSRRFFKTGPGEYGEGDIFVGVSVPALRKCARAYRDIPIADVQVLLHSVVHEERLLGLLILVCAFAKGDGATQRAIYRFYLDNTACVNNWDLVDTSAEHIVGAFLWQRSRRPLYRLAKSQSLWERRIAIMATFHFIKQQEFSETLAIARMLLADPEDLIHKAVGWMLREIGKRDMDTGELFLQGNYRRMPRTMLRYAIERFPEERRRAYLKGTV